MGCAPFLRSEGVNTFSILTCTEYNYSLQLYCTSTETGYHTGPIERPLRCIEPLYDYSMYNCSHVVSKYLQRIIKLGTYRVRIGK